jgi:CheY-like chemotaxis protein
VIVAKLLVVDDEVEVRTMLRRMLTGLGHEVWDVDDGVEALKLLETIPFDLVITDIYMVAVDGMELVVRMQQRGFQVPVVAMSGGGYKPRGEVLEMAASCGAVATLEKPFSLKQLRATIEPLLRGGAP